MVILHHILLVCVLTVDIWHGLALDRRSGILMETVSCAHRRLLFIVVSSTLAVVVGRENLRESVTHFQFPVKRSIENRTVFVNRSVNHCVFGSRAH